MSSQSADRGDVLVRTGAVVFGLGSVATLVTFVPLFFDQPRFPGFAYWLCMLMPLGFLISLGGLLVSARAQRRRVAAQASARAPEQAPAPAQAPAGPPVRAEQAPAQTAE